MKKVLLLSIVFVGSFLCEIAIINAQGVGINSSGNSADPSAMFDVSSDTKGTLITRMTTIQRDAIASPANGLMIWNTSTNCLDVYVVSSWQSLTCGCTSAPSTPGTITGSANVCANSTGVIYAIGAVSGASSYTWTVPAGVSITAGAGTTSITVNFGSSSGNISVTASNGCGTSSASSFAVTVSSTPATPGAISGSSTVCSNSSGSVYSISAVSGATTYTWSVPFGASITAGQNTTSITVTFGSSSGNISVTAANSCGTSYASTYAVTISGGSSASQTFNYSGSIVNFTIPDCVSSITIQAYGAQGGTGAGSNQVVGGKGAYMVGTVSVTPGNVLGILVGQQGPNYAAGGGGSFVWNTSTGNALLMAAAGGGGAGGSNNGGVSPYGGDGQITTTPSSGGGTGTAVGGSGGNGGSGGDDWPGWSGSGGGAGWFSNGANGILASEANGGGGYSPLNGGAGGFAGFNGSIGGFGGGGGCTYPGGGGGGYNGGGGGNAWNYNGAPNYSGGGGGGGSYYINGTPAAGSAAGHQTGNGQVILSW